MTNDAKLREAYERGLRRPGDRGPLDDLAAERLRRLVEQEGPEADRLHTLDATLSSMEGRQELEIVWAAARSAHHAQRHRIWWSLIAAAMLVSVGLTATWYTRRSDPAVVRADDEQLLLVGPTGDQAAGASQVFVWRAVRDAVEYRLTLVDSTGNERFAGTGTDTVLSLPDSVRLAPGDVVRWWVVAHLPLGDSLTSAPRRIEIRP